MRLKRACVGFMMADSAAMMMKGVGLMRALAMEFRDCQEHPFTPAAAPPKKSFPPPKVR